MGSLPGVPTLVLASASPGRLHTLERAGVRPLVVVSDVDEPAVVEASAAALCEDVPMRCEDVVLLLARAKAEDVAGSDQLPADALVLGCDSMLELDGQVLGKPTSAEQARERWRSMRGRSGVLHTGHWLVDTRDSRDGGSGATIGAVASTTVHFADIDDDEIDAYVATGEPLRVAGAFTLDSLGGAYVTGVEGDHHNVVGLSLPLLREMLADVGVRWHHLRHRA